MKQNDVRAVDTNIIVRFLTLDDVKQAKTAKAVMEAGDVFIGTTVILETEWVLRSAYGLAPNDIASSFRGLLGLPAIKVEERAAVDMALESMANGMDFADALHIARADHCSTFLSFDRKLVKRAAGITKIPVELP